MLHEIHYCDIENDTLRSLYKHQKDIAVKMAQATELYLERAIGRKQLRTIIADTYKESR